MRYHILASGSKGNCTVISDEETTIVIDAGTTNRHLKASFLEIDVDYKDVDGVLITHTHSDHIGRINLFKIPITTAATKMMITIFPPAVLKRSMKFFVRATLSSII